VRRLQSVVSNSILIAAVAFAQLTGFDPHTKEFGSRYGFVISRGANS
jgi:hypothetical protein